MTEEQRSRIRHAEEGTCCTFDELPMHPHFYYALVCAGFTSITDIEERTEEEFLDAIKHATTRGGKPLLHLNNRGASMAKFFKKDGVVFKSSDKPKP